MRSCRRAGKSGIDAALSRKDDATWLFKDDRFIASTQPDFEHEITDVWGHVRNNLADATSVDAVLAVDGRCAVVKGDQVFVYSGNLESPGLSPDEGYPRKLTTVFAALPEAFSHGLDAGLNFADGTINLFRDQSHAVGKNGVWDVRPIRERWGRVRNTLQANGLVDASLVGLDGKLYLFSGDQYIRYSGADLSRIDEGYPHTISADWGGMTRVGAALALDGKTYVFAEDHNTYVRYSGRDYAKPDEGYPRAVDDEFWNLPVALRSKFRVPDAIFASADGRVHFFSGDQYLYFDRNHRWWSEPVALREAWSSLPAETIAVEAAFTGRDGRTYLFLTSSGERGGQIFVRYTDPTFQRLDDGYPKPVAAVWGKQVNNLERTGRIDAAVTIVTAGADATARQHYVFSGDQFFRYSSDNQPFADEGYPLRIQNNLRREPHFTHIDASAGRGIDGVWADAGNVYLFVSDRIYAASIAHHRELNGLGVPDARVADIEDGQLVVLGARGWRHIGQPEAFVRTDGAPSHRPRGAARCAFRISERAHRDPARSGQERLSLQQGSLLRARSGTRLSDRGSLGSRTQLAARRRPRGRGPARP